MRIDNLIGDDYFNRSVVMEHILSNRVDSMANFPKVIIEGRIKDIVFCAINDQTFSASDDL